MGDVPFHLTVMGRRFYEATMPALVEAIERLNTNLEQLAPRLDALRQAKDSEADKHRPTGAD